MMFRLQDNTYKPLDVDRTKLQFFLEVKKTTFENGVKIKSKTRIEIQKCKRENMKTEF